MPRGYLVAVVVVGNMNLVTDIEDNSRYCLHPDVDLNGTWDGTGDGNTYGYQTEPEASVALEDWKPRRLDRFLYTGSIEPVATTAESVELIGKGLKPECVGWEHQSSHPDMPARFISGVLHTKFSANLDKGILATR